MKKIICTLLALIMLTGVCFAQTATLKPEVTLDWGMTIDETQPFFDTLSNVSKDEISGYTMIYGEGSFAYGSTLAGAIFNPEGKLFIFAYDEFTGSFDEVAAAIANDYGPASDITVDEFSAVLSASLGVPTPISGDMPFECHVFDDGNYLVQFYYDTSAFGIMALNPNVASGEASSEIVMDFDSPALPEGDPYVEYWGLDFNIVAATLGDTYKSSSELENISISTWEIDGLPRQFVFADNGLVAVVVDSIELYDYNLSYDSFVSDFTSAYGESYDDGGALIFDIMNTFVPGIYSSPSAFSGTLCWTISDETTLLIQYYDSENFSIMYANTALLFADDAEESSSNGPIGTPIGSAINGAIGTPIETPTEAPATEAPSDSASAWGNISATPEFATPVATEKPLTMDAIPDLWGINTDEAVAALGIMAYESASSVDGTYELIYESRDESDIISVFVNDGLVCVIYDYYNNVTADNYAELMATAAAQLGMSSFGGSDIAFTVLESIIPGEYTEAEFTDCRVWSMSNNSKAIMFKYDNDAAFSLIIVNTELFPAFK